MSKILKRVSNKTKYLLNNKAGFTLVEVVVVMFLLAIVLVIGMTFFIFGITSFNVSERRADVQQNARHAGEYISNQLRMAQRAIIIYDYDGDLEALNVEDLKIEIDQPSQDFEVYFIFLKTDPVTGNNMIYYQEVDGSYKPANILEGISRNINCNLDFKIDNTRKNILKITVEIMDIHSDDSYLMETELLILNLNNIEIEEGIESGSAIIFQTPSPVPSVRNIFIDPQSHQYLYGEERYIKVNMTTRQIAGGEEVAVELWKMVPDVDDIQHGIELVPLDSDIPFTPEIIITNSESVFGECEFRIKLLEPDNLYFGYYYMFFDIVDSGLFQQRRVYYIEPTLDITVEPLPGKAREAKVTILTGGVPEGTNVIKSTVADPENDESLTGDELFVGLVEVIVDDLEGTELIFYDYELSKPSAPTVLSDGSVVFYVTIDPVFDGKELYITAKIGRLSWLYDIETEVLSANAYLESLGVVGGTLVPIFDGDVLVYEIIDLTGDSITITAIADDINASIKISVNDVEIIYEEPVTIDLDGGENIIDIIVTAEDGYTVRTYKITAVK